MPPPTTSLFERITPAETTTATDTNCDLFWVRVQSENNVNLFCRHWKTQTPKAIVCFIHGLGEHSGRYDHVFKVFTASNIAVFAFDQRGFGRTAMLTPESGERIAARTSVGDSGGWQVSMDDIWRACTFTRSLYPDATIPMFLMGQSMGGLEAVCFAMDYCSATETSDKIHIAGCLAMSPAFAPGSHIPYLKKKMGGLLSKVLGSVNIPTDLDLTGLSSDADIIEQYRQDPFTHGVGSLRLLAALLDNGELVMKQKYKQYPMDIPLYTSFGSVDRITSFPASKELMEKVVCTDKTFKVYDGMLHELHNEPSVKVAAIKEYSDWILERAEKHSK